MFVKPVSSQLQPQPEVMGPFFFVFDRAAKSLCPDRRGSLHILPAQQLDDSKKRKRDAAGSNTIADQLERLQALFNNGALTQEQYQKAIDKALL